MNENLDLTEVLKNCLKGTKFYSKCFGELTFDCIINDRICLKDYSKFNRIYEKNGKYVYCDETAEIDLLPSKDQKDWSKWHRLFKDGDVITCTNSVCSFVAIFKETNTDITFTRYVSLTLDDEQQFCTKEGWADFKKPRFATEEEKQKLFDAIKARGYKWNNETKTLEKLIVPKFKVGDSIQSKKDNNYKFIITNIDNDGFYCGCGKNGCGKMCEFMIPVVKQDNWILIPNKFDPQTLQPFDKVLVRDYSGKTWVAAFFSHINDSNQFWYKFVTVAGGSYKQMIPYNDDTKHLLGTNNEAPEYYKCWED